MKKVYYIEVKSGTTKKPLHKEHIKEKIQILGAMMVSQNGLYNASYLLIPSDEGKSSLDIKREISQVVDPFSVEVNVYGMDSLSTATSNESIVQFIEQSWGHDKEPRNFSRFNTRHEAYMAYKRENPMWVYNDGIGAAVNVAFADWCWLPIKKDGIYEQTKYAKYL
jgi:hypothetical protein